MGLLADIVRQHGKAYRERHRATLLPSHMRALYAILHCRAPSMGGHLAECAECGREHLLYHSCRNRACPQCGSDSASRWLAKQRELLLPVPYFHVVFTLPAELRRLVRSHQKVLLSVLFRAAFESLASLCEDPHFLGAQIGALAVLHTWTRTLEWHPHVHLLVPGGGLASDGRTCGRFLSLARRALPGVVFPHIPWEKDWVVFAKPTAQGSERVLECLGRYVHRTAITDRAIVASTAHDVTFRYRDSRDGVSKTMTLTSDEFLRRFLQHVPPHGFHRVRAFGLLHPKHRDTLRRLQLLLTPKSPLPQSVAGDSPSSVAAKPRLKCPHCGSSSLRLLRRLSALECIMRHDAAGQRLPSLARAPPSPPLEAAGAAWP